jgi:peptide/nickel transport system permease protein
LTNDGSDAGVMLAEPRAAVPARLSPARQRWLYLRRRLVQAVPTILLIVSFNFFLLHLAPGDPVDVLIGEAGAATETYRAQLREQFGLDRSLLVQYGHYLTRALTLDLGYSFRYNAPNAELIFNRLGSTLVLMLSALVISIVVGSLLGFIAATRSGTVLARVILFAAVAAYASPLFWLGLMFIVVFALKLGWFPTSGITTIGAGYEGWRHALDVVYHAVLPSITLSLFYIALYTRLMRTAVLENLRLNYVTTARAKGIAPKRILLHHVLRNAVLPVLTMAGVQIGGMLGGSVVVESVFGWPGLGMLAFDALLSRDLNLLLGILLLGCVLVVITNIVVDLAYALVDPRVTLQ